MANLTDKEKIALNEAIFNALANEETSQAAVDAINAFTRSLLKTTLPFTGMPGRGGYLRTIMPPVALFPVAELEASGWPYNRECVYRVDGVPHAAHLYDKGRFYYELVEDRLREEDYQRRLRGRSVRRREWKSRQNMKRALAYYARTHSPLPGEPSKEEEGVYFVNVMSSLAMQILQAGVDPCLIVAAL